MTVAEPIKTAAAVGQGVHERVRRDVSEMLLRIERRGEQAIREYSRVLDDWDPPQFLLENDDLRPDAVPDALRQHIEFAQSQVRAFALAQLATLTDLRTEPLPGVVLGHRHLPVGAVGAYVPGGRYPMFASSFMTVLVAKAAGVPRVVACTPPQQGHGPPPIMRHAIATSGADAVLCLGGVQALAAMAFGHCGVAPVDMLVGAGNAYVAEAKRQLFGVVGIDLLAGPTEVLVIADDSADPDLVARTCSAEPSTAPPHRPCW